MSRYVSQNVLVRRMRNRARAIKRLRHWERYLRRNGDFDKADSVRQSADALKKLRPRFKLLGCEMPVRGMPCE